MQSLAKVSIDFSHYPLTDHSNSATSGFSVVAAEALPSDSTIVKIPFSLAITQQSSKDALSQILGDSSELESWNERQWIASYLSVSLILIGER